MNKRHRLITFSLLICSLCPLSASTAAEGALQVSSRTPSQGDTIEVCVTPGDAGSQEELRDEDFVQFNGHNYKLFPKEEASAERGSSRVVLIAVPADLDPGTYPLSHGNEEVSLTVRAGHFPLQHISLAPSKNNFDMSKGEHEAVESAKATVSSERFWKGTFSAPSKAPVSTVFGVKRTANGKLLKDYFHSGIDYRGGLGSSVMACANGNVVLVGRGFKLHGNTVAIDHGQGVVSFYIHLQTIKVKKGDTVTKGQIIGTVGQTGRATGPHLHFSIYVNEVAANPRNWYQTAF